MHSKNGMPDMSLPTSLHAYQSELDAYQRAKDAKTGIRIQFETQSRAKSYMARLHQARVLDRNENRAAFEPGDPMYAKSDYDAIAASIKEDHERSHPRPCGGAMTPGDISTWTEGERDQFCHELEKLIHGPAPTTKIGFILVTFPVEGSSRASVQSNVPNNMVMTVMYELLKGLVATHGVPNAGQ